MVNVTQLLKVITSFTQFETVFITTLQNLKEKADLSTGLSIGENIQRL